MTVAELIEDLKKYPPDLVVVCSAWHGDGTVQDIDTLEITERGVLLLY